jgi:hypothetical protein
MREAVDDAEELDDRARPAMGEHQRPVMRTGTPLVQQVDALPVDVGHELRDAIHRCLLRPPVEGGDPMRAEPAQERRRCPGRPGVARLHQLRKIIPVEGSHSCANAIEPPLRHVDTVG